jgi:hypothetical protein
MQTSVVSTGFFSIPNLLSFKTAQWQSNAGKRNGRSVPTAPGMLATVVNYIVNYKKIDLRVVAPGFQCIRLGQRLRQQSR